MESKTSTSRLSKWKETGLKYWRQTPTVLKALATLVIALNAGWQLYSHVLSPGKISSSQRVLSSSSEKSSATPKIETASKEKMAFPLPGKPSIAVLPFVNMSEDPKQEFFSDGITEEIITALSKIPKLFVIARNSTFTYKGKPVKVKQVSEELGVRYVLEGSVRKTGDKVRITAQLVDAISGYHIWAERYDRDLKEIFALQDEITLKITSALQMKLTAGEIAATAAKRTTNLDAYLKSLQAYEQFHHMNKQGFTMAKHLAKEALALDPEYGFPYTIIAQSYIYELMLGFSESPQDSMKLAADAAQKALVLDDSNPSTHLSLSALYISQRQYDKGIASAQRALELGPGEARAHASLGYALTSACRFSEAVQSLEQAIRLNPFPPGAYFYSLSLSYRFLGQYEEALVQLKKAHKLEPNHMFTHLGLAHTYTKLGRMEEAHAAAAEVLRINPKFTLEHWGKALRLKDPSAVDDIIVGLRKAGLK